MAALEWQLDAVHTPSKALHAEALDSLALCLVQSSHDNAVST